MSGIISAEPFMEYFPETHDDATWQGFVTAIYEIGCFLGAVFVLCFGDWLGRRRAMILGAFIMILGVVIQCSAIKGYQATAQFIIGRTMTGVGNGINTSVSNHFMTAAVEIYARGLRCRRNVSPRR